MIEVDYNEYKETIAENMRLIIENDKQDKEIERLNNIINKTIESVQEHYDNSYSTDDINDIGSGTYDDLMEILKGSNGVIPPEVIGTNGEDGGLFEYGDR